jgi:hypothetical protein
MNILSPSSKIEPLIVEGQGVFIFNHICKKNIKVYFYDKSNINGLKVVISNSNVLVYNIKNNNCYKDDNNICGFTKSEGIFYWISLDSNNQTIYVGIGEPRLETIIYKFSWNFDDKNNYEKNKLFLESLNKVRYNKFVTQKIKLLKNPIVNKVPLIVKNTEELSMNDIASNKYLPKSHLNNISQQLYDCISGPNFVLNDDDFPEFSQAIEYSIKTKGCWCYNKLKEKSREFDKDVPNIYETYLRITLGQNSGESPGIPYVMEIWPVGHYSPIHSHANSNAIIRVLNGSINVKLYPYLCNDEIGVKEFSETNFFLNDITWITPSLNQVHQLKNLETNTDTCITIQCYMYGNKNIKHYDYFDYINNNGNKQQYEPDSDMEFLKFKLKMKEEWINKDKYIKYF